MHQQQRHVTRLLFLPMLLAGIAAGTAHAGPPATTVVPLPCSNAASGQSSFMRSCSCYLNGPTAGGASCASGTGGTASTGTTAPPGVVSLIQTQLQAQASCYYQGVDLDPSANSAGSASAGAAGVAGLTDSATCNVNGTTGFGTPFSQPCSLAGNIFNGGKQETTQDHNGRSCGPPMSIAGQIANCGGTLPAELITIFTANGYTLQQVQGMSSSQLSSIEQGLENEPKYPQLPGLVTTVNQNVQSYCHSHSCSSSLPASVFPPEFLTIMETNGYTAQQMESLSTFGLAMNGAVSKVENEKKYPDLPFLAMQAQGSSQLCLSMSAGSSNLENAWVQGAFIQALAYHTASVLNEIQCSGSLSMSSDTSANPCATLAQDVATTSTQTQNMVSSLTAQLGGQGNIADIDFCAATWEPNPSPSSTVDPGQLRQSAQHLCAARSHLESAFTELAVCDILQQTQADYNGRFIGGWSTGNLGSNTPQIAMTSGFLNQMESNLDPICRPQCKGSSNQGQLTNCINNCYQQNIQSQYQKLYTPWQNPPAINNACPKPQSRNENGNTPQSTGLGLLIGSLGIGEGMRKRVRKSKTRIAKAVKTAILLGAYALAALCFQACSPSISTTVTGCVSTTTTTNNTFLGLWNSTDSTSTPITTGSCAAAAIPPVVPALPTSLGAGGADISHAVAEIAAAQNLTSNTTASGTKQTIPQALAQIQSGTAPIQPPTPAAGNSSNFAMPSYVSSNNSSGSGNLSTNTGGGSGSGPVAASDPELSAATKDALAANPDSADGLVAAGGAGGKAAAAAAKAKAQFGSRVGSGGNGGENSFGMGRDVAAMKSDDPSDYFTLIGVDNSIFKEVENKYRDKSLDWASSVSTSFGPGAGGSGAMR